MSKTTRTTWLGALAGLALLGAGAAQAQTLAALPQSSAPVAITGEARPLPAWGEFCRREPAECAVDLNEPAAIPLTSATWQLLQSVNQRVNATVRPMTDADHWGVADHWDIPTDGYGDCEDYQLLKRKLLGESGLSRRAMRMTVVIDEKGEGHAILLVRTTRGDLVLDNKTSLIRAWSDTGYVFVKRESQDAIGWVSLGGAISPVATANR